MATKDAINETSPSATVVPNETKGSFRTRVRGGYQPLQGGSQTVAEHTEKGYSPIDGDSGSSLPKPPSGGTGESPGKSESSD